MAPHLYKMRVVTRLTGFSPAVLRAWERRYGLLQPRRAAGGHRLFTDDDVTMLRHVRRLLDQGRSIGEIAIAGREALVLEANGTSTRESGVRGVSVSSGAQLRLLRDQIIRHAMQLDSAGIESALNDAFSQVGIDEVIESVIEPCARSIGDLWTTGGCSVASEHMASGVFAHRLRTLVETVTHVAADPRRIVLCCFPDEQHELGLLTLAYHCAKRGYEVCYLGQSLPFEDLEVACDESTPHVVMLSVTRPSLYQTHRPGLMALARRRAATVRIWVGGQGTPDDDPALHDSGVRLCNRSHGTADRINELVDLAIPA